MRKEFNKEDFYLPQTGLSKEQRAEALAKFDKYLDERKPNFLGFQADQALHYKEVLAKYLDFQINNLGDPFESGSFTINSKKIEQAVLDYYAKLWHGKPFNRAEPESCWGYVLSMGSTEGNLYGLWNARDYLRGMPLSGPLKNCTQAEGSARRDEGGESPEAEERTLQVEFPNEQDEKRVEQLKCNAHQPVLFYSQDTHYSIVKAQQILGLKTFYDVGMQNYRHECPLSKYKALSRWPRQVPSEGGLLKGTGSIAVEDLTELVGFFAERGHPIIVLFNYGTAFRGAYDDIETAWRELEPILMDKRLQRTFHIEINGKRVEGSESSRDPYWFHVDGALGASYMPFIERAYAEGLMPFVDIDVNQGQSELFPRFDFELPCVKSISMSGHKWGGAPWPCGVYMTKRKYQLKPPSDPKYIGAHDSTLAGSRNGLSALILWDYLARTSLNNEVKKALYTQRMANYAHQRLLALENELKRRGDVGDDGLWIQRPPLSLSVCFKKVRDDIMDKYSLNKEEFEVEGRKRAYNHIFAMEHVTEDTIDRLVEDLSKPGAFSTQNGETNPLTLIPKENASGESASTS
jgi:histidine decarboxylase